MKSDGKRPQEEEPIGLRPPASFFSENRLGHHLFLRLARPFEPSSIIASPGGSLQQWG